MDFKRTRGKRATARCKKAGTYGSSLYCDCGCQEPTQADTYSLDGLTAKWEKGFQVYIALVRDGEIVGSMDPARDYISLDHNEYLGVVSGSALALLFDLPIGGKRAETITTAGSTADETAAQEYMAEERELAEMDARNEGYPGYCTKCHGFCYGDCSAN